MKLYRENIESFVSEYLLRINYQILLNKITDKSATLTWGKEYKHYPHSGQSHFLLILKNLTKFSFLTLGASRYF